MRSGMRENLLTKRDVATILNVSVRTVERYVSEAKLQPVKLSARCIRFTPAEVDKFIRNRGGAQ